MKHKRFIDGFIEGFNVTLEAPEQYDMFKLRSLIKHKKFTYFVLGLPSMVALIGLIGGLIYYTIG